MWASPNVSAYLHVDSTDYIVQYMLHGLGGPCTGTCILEQTALWSRVGPEIFVEMTAPGYSTYAIGTVRSIDTWMS